MSLWIETQQEGKEVEWLSWLKRKWDELEISKYTGIWRKGSRSGLFSYIVLHVGAVLNLSAPWETEEVESFKFGELLRRKLR